MSFSEWKEFKLIDICTYRTGKLNSNAAVINGKYPFFTCSPETLRINEYSFDQDAVILAGNNASGVFSIKHYKGKFDAYQRTYIINTLDENIVNNKYLYYFLGLQLNQLKQLSVGSATKFLTKTILDNIIVKVPSNEVEMKSIANILSTLDEKIEVNNQINKTLEDMAQAIFKQWFVDFDFPNENGEPYKSSGGEMVESEIGMIPKGWEVKKLGEFIKFIKGKKPKVIDEKDFDGSKVYLTIDVLNRNSILYCSTEKTIETNKYNALMVMDGASSGSLFYGQDGIVASTLAKIEVTSEMLSDEFIYYTLKLYEDEIKAHTTGSAIPHTDKEYVNKLVISIPRNLEIIKLFEENVSLIREKIINNEQESVKLKNIRDTLLPKLMSGEIRVPINE